MVHSRGRGLAVVPPEGQGSLARVDAPTLEVEGQQQLGKDVAAGQVHVILKNSSKDAQIVIKKLDVPSRHARFSEQIGI
jgi:hypothetical protein